MNPIRIIACLAPLLVAVPAGAAERPNVVILLADDLGWADVGFHGGTQIDTPSLDRLAREGVQLDRFCTTPICSPTRAALMTRRDPLRLGVAYGVIMPWHNNGIHPAEHFMPESFRAAGYQTAILVPPPGWRAPKNWAGYPIPLKDLRDDPAPGMPPKFALPVLDWQHGELGRLLYDCEPYPILGGGLCR